MKCLLVIDMQEDYVGDSRNVKMYPYKANELIESINEKILEYPNESVIYIVNRFFWELGRKQKKLVDGLSVISNNVFEKRMASCFSNKLLLEHLQRVNASELELVGVDGNYCVGASAIDGITKKYRILFNESLIGVGNYKKFKKMKNKLKKMGVIFIS
ncbi:MULTISPECIES: isochorismatase family protein [unclassified Clostridium]|uniref:isochorismatase family protein n=1 Tax=unclassified Clostridium TaxID=2614128 RepID=UPI000297D2EF|nr:MULTISPECIES: isochorismatase family protein [unclassified Clostridium]EKQ56054.1 MAG: nicotinamidase-like amidase [Clostridium sp. Maddingley MBC34-26]